MKESHIGYIYKITHVPTGRYYIGQRVYRGDVSKDPYMGSGRKIRNLLKSHPDSEFHKVILFMCSTREELNLLEFESIADKHITDELCLNLVAGGGQPGFSQETREKMSKSLTGNKNGLGYHHADDAKKRISKSTLGNKRGLGYKHTKASIAKMCTPICQLTIDGFELMRFASIKEAADSCGISSSGIGRCVSGERKTAGGFRWKKLEQ